mgnify:CR=1 FL=1
MTLKTIQNNETSKMMKYSDRQKNKTIVARMVPPPTPDSLGTTELVRKNANPIRHYRQQLTGTNTARILIRPRFDVPRDTIVKTTEPCATCNDNIAMQFKEEIYPNPDNAGQVCATGCLPKNTIIKSANTNLSKHYSTSNRDYLKNRGLTYKNNLYSETITRNPRNCDLCNNNNRINNNNNNNTIQQTGNINNSIGATDMSSYIYKKAFRDIDNLPLNNNNNNNNKEGLCCPGYTGTVLYKSINNRCVRQDYPNLSRHKILCRFK